MAEYPRVVESAAAAMEPHRIAYYLYDLASTFHAHYDKGRKNPDLRFVKDNNRELTVARLGLVRAVAEVLKSGLSITGTSAPEEM
jgi:arginyl-tRNA synthetase